MTLKNISISRAKLKMFSTLLVTAILTSPPVLTLKASTVSRAPQSSSPCLEDFTSDTDAGMAGFAGSVFNHSLSGSFMLGRGFPGDPPGHSLALFAGATDVITFPGQRVTYAKVQIFSFSPGMIIIEGAGDMLTTRFSPAPIAQIREATDTTEGDNDRLLGQILRVTLVGFETLFDNIEISPCGGPPAPGVPG